MKRYVLLVVWLVAAVVSGGCGRSRPNVLLVTFDTTRWDHVGYASGRNGLTPTVDALAERGTWFETCLTSQPLTLPAHTTILTGLYPYRHGVRNNGTYIASDELETLAESLQTDGYATHAIVSAFVLDSQFGLAQGFDAYDDDLSGGPKQKMFMFKELKAEQIASKAVRWIEGRGESEQPFFLWLHFFDPHADYEPPPDVATRFPGDPYSGEIFYADRELGRVVSALEETGVLDNTVIAFTSDHGDGLGDHGEKTHGIFVYESTTRVPLVLAGPGVPSGMRAEGLSRTVDIAPTVLDLIGLPIPADSDGHSLRPLWGGTDDGRTAYLETLVPRLNFGWAELRALRSASTKVIDAPRPEAYDLAQDPGETRNLPATDESAPVEADSLRTDLEKVIESDPFTHGEQRQADLDPETREKLASLGYVWAADDDDNEERPDPKDRLGYWERFQETQSLIRVEAYHEARTAITELLAADPENVVVMGSLALVLAKTDDPSGALELYRRMIELDPSRETPYLGAARVLSEEGRFDEAESLARAVVEMQPDNPEGYTVLGDLHLEQERFAEAEPWFHRALEVDPHSMLAASGLGNCLNRAGRIQEAHAVLSAAHAHDPDSHAVTYNLGVVMERMGEADSAAELYRAAIRLEPDHSMSWNNLGSLLDRQGKREEAIRLIARAHELNPENVEATYNLGALLLAVGRPAEALPLLEDALRLRPDLTQAAAMRARAFEGLGRKPEALVAWRDLMKVRPEVGLQVARLELEAGREVEAQAALEIALDHGGDRARQAALRHPGLSELMNP